MFVCEKVARGHRYLYLVESVREGKRVRQRTIRALGRKDVLPAHGEAVEAASLVPPDYLDSVPPPTDEDHAEARAEAAWEVREDPAPSAPEPPKPDWRSAWEPVVGEWNALIDRARRSGTIEFYTAGYAEVMARMQVLADTPGIPSDKRAQVIRVLENRDGHVAARKRVKQFLDAARRYRDRRTTLEEAADQAGVAVTQAPQYGQWRGAADRLKQEGQTILAGRDTFDPHLDNIPAARERTEMALTSLSEAIKQDDEDLAEARRESYLRGQLIRTLARLRFGPVTAPDIGAEPSPPGPGDDGTLARRALWRLRRVHDWDGRLVASERQAAIEAGTRASLARWESLKERWDRQLDLAEKEGVHVIYTDGYGALRREMSSATRDDPYLAEGTRSEVDRVIGLLDTPEAMRRHVEEHRDTILAWLERRGNMLDYVSAWDTRPAPDARRYDAWRESIDKAVTEAEIEFTNRRVYGIHLDGLKHRGEGPGSALSKVREVLAEDDRYMAEALVPERKGDDPRRREERIAGLLDDPEKLRELHRRQIERKEARKAARQRRKGRYQVRSMRM